MFSFLFSPVLLHTVHSLLTREESEIDSPPANRRDPWMEDGWERSPRREQAVTFFSLSLCLPPSGIPLAASAAANDAVFAMAFGVKEPENPSDWEASERFVVIADVNASLKVPPTRYFGQVRVCGVSRCHEQTIHRLLKKKNTHIKRLHRAGEHNLQRRGGFFFPQAIWLVSGAGDAGTGSPRLLNASWGRWHRSPWKRQLYEDKQYQ